MTLLAYIPSPPQGVWYLGPIPIRAYALCIIIGIIAAMYLGDKRWEERGGDKGTVYDIAWWAVIFGLIGGRLYHVLTDWPTYFGDGGQGFIAALNITQGGLGIWGAVALGGVGAWIGCRRRGIPLPAFGDAIAPGIILAQAIGRLGNYFNQELYGRETTVPWGLEIYERRDSTGYISVHSLDGVSTGQVGGVVHPTFLYELIWNLAIFALLMWADRRFNLGHGRLFALYVAGYCVGRFGVELLRDDPATLIAGVRINTFTATFVFIGAVVYMILAPKGREEPDSLKGRLEPDDQPAEGEFTEVAKELTKAAATTGVVAGVAVALDKTAEAELEEQDAEPPAAQEAVAAVKEKKSKKKSAGAKKPPKKKAAGAKKPPKKKAAVPVVASSNELADAGEPLSADAQEPDIAATDEIVAADSVDVEPADAVPADDVEPVGDEMIEAEPVDEAPVAAAVDDAAGDGELVGDDVVEDADDELTAAVVTADVGEVVPADDVQSSSADAIEAEPVDEEPAAAVAGLDDQVSVDDEPAGDVEPVGDGVVEAEPVDEEPVAAVADDEAAGDGELVGDDVVEDADDELTAAVVTADVGDVVPADDVQSSSADAIEAEPVDADPAAAAADDEPAEDDEPIRVDAVEAATVDEEPAAAVAELDDAILAVQEPVDNAEPVAAADEAAVEAEPVAEQPAIVADADADDAEPAIETPADDIEHIAAVSGYVVAEEPVADAPGTETADDEQAEASAAHLDEEPDAQPIGEGPADAPQEAAEPDTAVEGDIDDEPMPLFTITMTPIVVGSVAGDPPPEPEPYEPPQHDEPAVAEVVEEIEEADPTAEPAEVDTAAPDLVVDPAGTAAPPAPEADEQTDTPPAAAVSDDADGAPADDPAPEESDPVTEVTDPVAEVTASDPEPEPESPNGQSAVEPQPDEAAATGRVRKWWRGRRDR